MLSFKEFLLESSVPKWDGVTYLDKHTGDIDAYNQGLKELPFDFSSFDIKGGFYCGDNKLNSLKGSPKSCVCFNASNNEITNLIGSPKEVGDEGFIVTRNHSLTSLKGIPRKIEGDFSAYFCDNLFEVSPILGCEIGGKISLKIGKDNPVDAILNKYKNNPKNLIKMLVELKQIDKRYG